MARLASWRDGKQRKWKKLLRAVWWDSKKTERPKTTCQWVQLTNSPENLCQHLPSFSRASCPSSVLRCTAAPASPPHQSCYAKLCDLTITGKLTCHFSNSRHIFLCQPPQVSSSQGKSSNPKKKRSPPGNQVVYFISFWLRKGNIMKCSPQGPE